MYFTPDDYGCSWPWPFLWRDVNISVLLFDFCCTDVEVDVDELNQEQVLDINKMAASYGMAEGDFVR